MSIQSSISAEYYMSIVKVAVQAAKVVANTKNHGEGVQVFTYEEVVALLNGVEGYCERHISE